MMTGESATGDLVSPLTKIGRETQVPVGNNTLLNAFDTGFRRLPKLYAGDMHKRFSGDFPFDIAPWKIGVGRRILKKVSHQIPDQDINPVKLDPITEFKQQTKADCVGASIMSAFSEITGISPTQELYEGFLQTALKRGLAQREEGGVKVLPFAINVFSTSEFKRNVPSLDVTVAYRKGLSIGELSEIVRATRAQKSPPYKLFVFLPFSSWTNPGGAHLVTLQEIGLTTTTVYDPQIGEKRVLSNAEFNQKWEYDNKGAIFIFAK